MISEKSGRSLVKSARPDGNAEGPALRALGLQKVRYRLSNHRDLN